MTTADFVKIEKRLLPSFGNFAIKGKLMIMRPVEHTLRGFYFEPSGFSKSSFYVGVFFMPLCVPREQPHFTFGRRLKRDRRWSIEDADVEETLTGEMKKEVHFLVSINNPGAVAMELEPMTKPNAAGYVNPNCCEAFAYMSIKAGDIATGERVIQSLMKLSISAVKWEREIAARAQLMIGKLAQGPEQALSQLVLWEWETIRKLSLETVRA